MLHKHILCVFVEWTFDVCIITDMWLGVTGKENLLTCVTRDYVFILTLGGRLKMSNWFCIETTEI